MLYWNCYFKSTGSRNASSCELKVVTRALLLLYIATNLHQIQFICIIFVESSSFNENGVPWLLTISRSHMKIKANLTSHYNNNKINSLRVLVGSLYQYTNWRRWNSFEHIRDERKGQLINKMENGNTWSVALQTAVYMNNKGLHLL